LSQPLFNANTELLQILNTFLSAFSHVR